MFIWRYGRGEHAQPTGLKTVSDERIRQSSIFAWSLLASMLLRVIGYYCPGYYIEHVGTVGMVGAIFYGLFTLFNRREGAGHVRN